MKLVVFTDYLNERIKNVHLDYYEKLAYRLGTIEIVSIGKLTNVKGENLDLCLQHINVVVIENYSSLIGYLKKNRNIVIINNFSEKISYWYIYFLINIFRVPMIRLFNIITNQNLFLDKTQSTKNNKFLTKKNIQYLMYKTLLKLNVLASVDIMFVSGIKAKGFYYNKIGFNQVENVNNIAYDKLLELNYKISGECIVFLDSKVTYSQDQIKMGYSLIDEKYYFDKLNKFFDMVERKFDKKVVICAHPSYDLSKADKHYNGRLVVKNKSYEYISKAYLVFFHNTQSINIALLYRKPILILESDNFNVYLKNQINAYKNTLNMKAIDFENPDENVFTNLFTDSDTLQYEEFLNNNLIVNKKSSSIDDVIKILQKRYES